MMIPMTSERTTDRDPRTVLITGTSRGIGRFLANRFLDAGDRVIGCSRQPSDLQHSNYLHLISDLSQPDQVDEMINSVRKEVRSLNVLINNAGIASMGPAALQPPSVSKRMIDLNFYSTVHVTHNALRLLRKSVDPRIINLTSVAVPLRLEGEAVYSATKAAVEQWTRVLAKEVGPFGITVNAIGPTPIDTDLIRGVSKGKLDELVARQAIPRWATMEDVANVVDFYLQSSSRMITGQVIYLGGIA
jgi:3-oxoacyl-[acyl-carrier protein] reductase